jgi:large conductance mechanosensitive channel
MLKEFKEFALRGSLLDLAVAFIMGAAFGKIITSLVNDIIMPPIGLLLGKVDFSSLYINLTGGDYLNLAAAQQAGAPTINYGVFINTLLDFIIVAFVMFLVIRASNRLSTPKPAAAPAEVTSKECPFCLSTIPIKATRCPNCTSGLK